MEDNHYIYIDRAIRKRQCTVCHDSIPKGTHHLAVMKDYRYNICFDCLLRFARLIRFYDLESK